MQESLPRALSGDVGHEGFSIKLVRLCVRDHGLDFVHQLDVRLGWLRAAGFFE